MSLTHAVITHLNKSERALVSEFTTSPAIAGTGRWRLCSVALLPNDGVVSMESGGRGIIRGDFLHRFFSGGLDKISRR